LDEQKFSDTDQIFCLDSIGGFEGDGKEHQNYKYFDFSYIDLLSQVSWFIYSFQDMKNYVLGNQIFWVNLDEMKRLRTLEEKITASEREEAVHPKLFCHPDEGLPLWIQMDYLFFLEYLKKIGGDWELSKEEFLSFFPQSADLATQILKEQSRKSKSPCVSIVIPVKNSACHLERLLKSLENLNYPKDCLEIIVVDNDSTDSTVETAQRFTDVRVYIEKKASSYAARNKGIINSTHDFIAFLDADCVADSNWLKEIVEPLVKDKRVGFVGGINRPLSEDAFLSKMERGQGGYRNIERKAYCGYGYAITMNVIYRRKVFQSVGMFDDTVISGSDVDMSWRAQKDGKWRFVRLDDKALVYHDDIKSFKSAFHRHHRIGSGHYFLYFKKYPHWLLQHYFFLPRSEVEIYAQFIKLMLRSFLVKRGNVSFFEEIFIHFRAMAQKIGLLNAMKNAKARSQIETIYIYDKGCDLSYFTCEVQDLITRSSSSKEKKLFIGGAYKGIENLFFYFKRMLKLTTVWVWPNDTMYIKPLNNSKWQSIFGRIKKEVDLNVVQKVIYTGKDKDSLVHFLDRNFKQIVCSELQQAMVE
jgi:glycosyltransferase involved in cell wall biosynthesis